MIQTDRLLLRPVRVEDAPVLHAIANQPYVLQWMPDWQTSVETLEAQIRYFISQYPLANATTARVVFVVELEGTVIGMVGIGNKEEVDNEIEIAYFLSQDYAGKGYATEAARAVSRWALDTLGMEYLIAIVEPDNGPSQRVVEKCGFAKIDTRMVLNAGDTEEKPFYYYRLAAR